MDLDQIREQAAAVTCELLAHTNLSAGDILVVGCSSSEVAGGAIGKNSSYEAAQAVFDGIAPLLRERGIYLAAQCCEHLNRALIVEAAIAGREDIVCVVPKPKAGGSFATVAWERFSHPVAVERIAADAGIDVGDTLIGMHLRAVAVPVRIQTDRIGKAHVVCARTRPKLIGGERAQYE